MKTTLLVALAGVVLVGGEAQARTGTKARTNIGLFKTAKWRHRALRGAQRAGRETTRRAAPQFDLLRGLARTTDQAARPTASIQESSGTGKWFDARDPTGCCS
jgi:hypothetical protein